MTDQPTRRSLLRGAFQLSILGASVPLVTRRVFAGEPTLITRDLLSSYNAWLHYEHRLLAMEMYPELGADADRWIPGNNMGAQWHFRSTWPQTWEDLPQPSTRAALVLSAVGCDWRRKA